MSPQSHEPNKFRQKANRNHNHPLHKTHMASPSPIPPKTPHSPNESECPTQHTTTARQLETSNPRQRPRKKQTRSARTANRNHNHPPLIPQITTTPKAITPLIPQITHKATTPQRPPKTPHPSHRQVPQPTSQLLNNTTKALQLQKYHTQNTSTVRRLKT